MKSPHVYEVQFHSARVRRGVRTFFLRRGHLRVLVGLAVVEVLVLLAGLMVVAPVVRGFAGRAEVARLTASRTQQGERLKALLTQLDRLDEDVADLALRMEKVHVAYGLSGEDPAGTGGFPRQPALAVPVSIYGENLRAALGLEARISEELEVLGSFLTEIREFEAAHQERIRLTPSASPLRGPDFVLTSPYGTRRNPFTKALDFHAGLDLAAPPGSPIHAPADGVVVFAGRYPLKSSVSWWRYGNLVVLRHGDLFVTLFGHCQDVTVKTGQRVRQGDVVATVGSTGWSTSPHLHYEVRRLDDNGREAPYDPRIYILDHVWRDEERVLVASRQAPDPADYEPLPAAFGRSRRP